MTRTPGLPALPSTKEESNFSLLPRWGNCGPEERTECLLAADRVTLYLLSNWAQSFSVYSIWNCGDNVS